MPNYTGTQQTWWLIASESSLDPKAFNEDSGAAGLIQFLPKVAEDLGTNTDEILKELQRLGQIIDQVNESDKLIEEDSISDKIIKGSIEKALKGDPILEHEFDVPFGGKGKVSIDNSLQQGGIMLIWDLGGNYKLKEWKQKKGEQ